MGDRHRLSRESIVEYAGLAFDERSEAMSVRIVLNGKGHGAGFLFSRYPPAFPHSTRESSAKAEDLAFDP
jgi:hypothetical protein